MQELLGISVSTTSKDNPQKGMDVLASDKEMPEPARAVEQKPSAREGGRLDRPQRQELIGMFGVLQHLLKTKGEALSRDERKLIEESLCRLYPVLPTLEKQVYSIELLKLHQLSPRLQMMLVVQGDAEIICMLLNSEQAVAPSVMLEIARRKEKKCVEALARRKEMNPYLLFTLLERADASVIRLVLENPGLELDEAMIEMLVNHPDSSEELLRILMTRENFPPALALSKFWGCRSLMKRMILLSCTSERRQAQSVLRDFFSFLERRVQGDVVTDVVSLFDRRNNLRTSKDPQQLFAAIHRMMRQPDEEQMRVLHVMTGFSVGLLQQIAGDKGGESLATLLKTINFKPDLVERLFENLVQAEILEPALGEEDAFCQRSAAESLGTFYTRLSSDQACAAMQYWHWLSIA